ncbi:MAG: DUF4249 domain-containing protein [Chlorobi bacterium]|nr:DUF4249 domain-containing protein [Chlorobiota bacterium]
MKKNIKYYLHKNRMQLLIALFVVFGLISCETQTNWKLKTEEVPVIIVDGLITNEIKAHEVIITKPVTELNGIPEAVTGANVTIVNNNKTYLLNENTANPGIYKTDSTFSAVIGKKYTLYIKYMGYEYTAVAEMVPLILFEPLIYSFREDTGMYKIDYVAEQYTTDAAMYQIDIDWTQLPGYDSISMEQKRVRLYYYSLPTIDVGELFAPDKENIFFPAGAIITEKKYALTAEHAAFIRSLLAETEWRGGYFDVIPGNIETNMSEGALGFFGACTVATITITVN